MPGFEQHIFICGNTRPDGHPRGCCDAVGNQQLCDAFREALREHGLAGRVRANKAGCLDQCEYGPTVVIYPQGIWYGRVRPEDAATIVEATILGGKLLSEFQIPDVCLNTKGQIPWPDQTESSDS